MSDSLHKRIGALKDLDRAIRLELNAVVKDFVVSFEHKFFQFELILLNHAEQIFFPLLSSFVNICELGVLAHLSFVLVADIKMHTHILPILLHTNELPQTFTVVHKTHDIANFMSMVTLSCLYLFAFYFLSICSIFLCDSLVTSSLIGLFSFLLFGEELGLGLFAELAAPLICSLSLELLPFQLFLITPYLFFTSALSFRHFVVEV